MIDFASWVYFFANVGFWSYVPRTLLLSDLDVEKRLSIIGLAGVFLVVLRCILETAISLIRIAKNTSK